MPRALRLHGNHSGQRLCVCFLNAGGNRDSIAEWRHLIPGDEQRSAEAVSPPQARTTCGQRGRWAGSGCFRIKKIKKRLASVRRLTYIFVERVGQSSWRPARGTAIVPPGYLGVTHKAVHLLRPTTQATPKALTQEPLTRCCAFWFIRNAWSSAVASQHSRPRAGQRGQGHQLPIRGTHPSLVCKVS